MMDEHVEKYNCDGSSSFTILMIQNNCHKILFLFLKIFWVFLTVISESFVKISTTVCLWCCIVWKKHAKEHVKYCNKVNLMPSQIFQIMLGNNRESVMSKDSVCRNMLSALYSGRRCGETVETLSCSVLLQINIYLNWITLINEPYLTGFGLWAHRNVGDMM